MIGRGYEEVLGGVDVLFFDFGEDLFVYKNLFSCLVMVCVFFCMYIIFELVFLKKCLCFKIS